MSKSIVQSLNDFKESNDYDENDECALYLTQDELSNIVSILKDNPNVGSKRGLNDRTPPKGKRSRYNETSECLEKNVLRNKEAIYEIRPKVDEMKKEIKKNQCYTDALIFKNSQLDSQIDEAKTEEKRIILEADEEYNRKMLLAKQLRDMKISVANSDCISSIDDILSLKKDNYDEIQMNNQLLNELKLQIATLMIRQDDLLFNF